MTSDAPKVLMETVKAAGAPFVTGMLGGTVQMAPNGAPAQVNDSVPLNPTPGVACRLNRAVCPAVSVAVVEPPAAVETVAAGNAVPLRLMNCGEFAALSVMVSVVARMPEARGENTSAILQEALAATEPLQVSVEMLKSAALNPLRTALRICKGAPPEFVSVTVCAAVEVPCVGVPGKVTAPAGFSVTAGEGGMAATAVPASGMIWGLPAALSVTISVA